MEINLGCFVFTANAAASFAKSRVEFLPICCSSQRLNKIAARTESVCGFFNSLRRLSALFCENALECKITENRKIKVNLE